MFVKKNNYENGKLIFNEEDLRNENNFSVHRVRSSSTRRMEAPNFLR